MNKSTEILELLGEGLLHLLDQLDEGVMVLDQQRSLRYANARARQILGYQEGEEVGGRCRLSTRGVDCSSACPLTYALEGDLDTVERFSTVYRGREDRPVPLDVTLLPLRNPEGEFTGAVEILRPSEPHPGFLAIGDGDQSQRLRQTIRRLAHTDGPLVLAGEAPACADVAAAIHRFSGLDQKLFQRWQGSWEEVDPWPPGTLYGEGELGLKALHTQSADGWRVIVGVVAAEDLSDADRSQAEVIRLPDAEALAADLQLVVATWIEQLRPGLKASPEAIERLSRMARIEGLAGLQPVLATAVAAADSRLEDNHIPGSGPRSVVVDELLGSPEPLAALEQCLLRETVERCSWRMQEAADRLGISRVTLWRKLKEHGIERPTESG